MFGRPPAWADLAKQLQAVQLTQKEILSKMANDAQVISALVTGFDTLKTDVGKFIADSTAFQAKVTAFIASTTSGSSGTVLSDADRQAASDLAASIQLLDTQSTAADAAIGAIVIPDTGSTPAAPSAPAGS